MIYHYRQHAIKRMFERGITQADLQAALSAGQVIEDYPNDYPLPSRLWLGYAGNRPLHIVYADTPQGERIIITVYEPNPAHWTPDFTQRVKP
jgi:hypothetical protein